MKKASTKKCKDVFKSCEWTKIALQISYIGKGYGGFEFNTEGKTIESELFHAMRRVKIINSEIPEYPIFLEFLQLETTLSVGGQMQV